MKWKLDKKQIHWGLTAFLVAACVLLFYYLLFHGQSITKALRALTGSMMSVIYGIIIAYVLSPVMHLIEKRVFMPHYKRKGVDLYAPESARIRSRIRHISVLITIVFFLFILILLLAVVIPQLVRSVRSIVISFPIYVNNAARMSNMYLSDHPEIAQSISTYLDEVTEWLMKFMNNTVIPQATVFLRRFSQSVLAFLIGLFNFIIGIIVAVYLLNGKERFKSQGKKLVYALFKENTANELISGFRFAHYTFSGFIVGKLFDSLLIGVICYIGTLVLHTPYPVLMAVIVGVTNVIPFFGPYIGEILTFLLLILIHPVSALAFFAFLFVLQQFDGNILGPKILGNSTGLSSFWVIFSVLLFGNLFGVVGWILGVPIFAILYALVRRIANDLLDKKELPTQTILYGDVAYVKKGKPVLKRDADWDLYHVRHPQSAWKRIFSMKKEVGSRIAGVVHPSGAEPKENSGVEPDTAPKEILYGTGTSVPDEPQDRTDWD
ncbi:MAG: AI-2E family transporter [Lachnospiraceae bacterium]|nr:AI-2E family transporter [Lachnospiraceae bacterium]